MEAPPGIEPGYTDLQSAASPLRHGAILKARYSHLSYVMQCPKGVSILYIEIFISAFQTCSIRALLNKGIEGYSGPSFYNESFLCLILNLPEIT